MCWSAGVTVTLVAAGTAATGVAIWRREPTAIWATIGYFTAMEALQVGGYAVIDQCGTPANRWITILSILHIAFQPFFVNAFAMQLVPAPVRRRVRRQVYAVCAAATGLMLLQLVPIPALGTCTAGFPLCGTEWCTRAGDWHIAWDVPYNGLSVPFERMIGSGFGFPAYMVAAFALPLVYGAWRFVTYHALVGPILASLLTTDPNEMPAIWCLLSIALVLLALSPAIRRHVETDSWWGRPVQGA